MNNRLIELYKEASEFAYQICQEEGRAGGIEDHIWNTLSVGKFAELIVQDCIATIKNTEANCTLIDEKYGCMYAEVDLIEHFGVK